MSELISPLCTFKMSSECKKILFRDRSLFLTRKEWKTSGKGTKERGAMKGNAHFREGV